MRLSRLLFAASLFLALAPALGFAQQKCAAAKIKAAAKKAACKAGVEAKQALLGGAAVDPAKVAKCESAFSKTFAKLEAKGGCRTTGDTAAIEAKVDAFVADLDDELACPNVCLNRGTVNGDCSCTCPSGYESLNGGCFRISNTGPGDDCGGPGCHGSWYGSIEGSGNYLCSVRISSPPSCSATSDCPLGSACYIFFSDSGCVSQCTAP